MTVLQVKRIVVREGKMDFELSCTLPSLHADEGCAERVLGLLPNVARHVCVNRKGERFGDELVGTELPHLFEHVAIELLGQAFPAQAAAGAFSGYTAWQEELAATRGRNVALMRVTLVYLDDLAAMQAATCAAAIVNWTVFPTMPVPDIEDMVKKVAAAGR